MLTKVEHRRLTDLDRGVGGDQRDAAALEMPGDEFSEGGAARLVERDRRFIEEPERHGGDGQQANGCERCGTVPEAAISERVQGILPVTVTQCPIYGC